MLKKQIPNFLTLLNLFFGCLAIMFTFQEGAMASFDAAGDMIVEIPVSIFYASLFIGLAAIMDFFDGFAARWLKVSSEMG
ncbi:MAG: CDP-diacylglycerol--serine O-phosphatidyltransferase, partial [Bacteroidota bacterium]